MKKTAIIFAVLAALAAGRIRSQSVTVTTVTAWNPSSTHSGSAGLDLNNTYTGTMGAYRLRMRGGAWGSTWHVDVRFSLPAGSPALTLEVQRDPANTNVIGGASWVPVGATNTYFFRSNAKTNVNTLNIQYRIGNVTTGDPTIDPGALPITITYTIVHSLTHPP
jgi:hypothetical protein